MTKCQKVCMKSGHSRSEKKYKRKINIIGLDLVEFQPHKDLHNYWANNAARILIELMSML